MSVIDVQKQHLDKNTKVVAYGFGALLISGVFLAIVSNSAIKDPFYLYDKAATKKLAQASSVNKAGVLGVQTLNPGYILTVNNTKVIDQTGELNEDEKHIAVDVTFVNTGDHVLQMSPLLQMHLQNDKGGLYPVNAALSEGEELGGPIPIGATVKGTVDFAVPKNTSIKKLSFQLDDKSNREQYDLR
jgi:hypothetical protein